MVLSKQSHCQPWWDDSRALDKGELGRVSGRGRSRTGRKEGRKSDEREEREEREEGKSSNEVEEIEEVAEWRMWTFATAIAGHRYITITALPSRSTYNYTWPSH